MWLTPCLNRMRRNATRERIRTHYIKKIVHSGRGATIPLEQTMCRVESNVDPV